MKPSILITNPHFNLYGGAERQVSELANYLTDQNYKITVASTYMCPEFKASLKETRIWEAGSEQSLLEFVNKYSHKFDLHNPHNHPCELYFSYPLKPKVVWMLNEPPGYILEGQDINPQERAYVQRMIKKIVVISDFDFARCRKIYSVDATVNYPGVKYDFFAQTSKIRNTLNMKNNFVLTQINYFTWTKRQDLTVEIFAQVKKQIPNAKLVLIGYNAWSLQYPFVKKVHDKIAELGLEDDVFISDYLAGDENLRNIYNQTSVCLQPVNSQGSWATIFEGISAGVPTIVSDDFVASNLVCNNNLGWVSGNVLEEYVNKIMHIYSNYQKSKEDTVANATWIRDNLTWKKFGEKYSKILEEVVNG